MKHFKLLFYLIPFAFAMTQCTQGDDICTSGGTPKMKVRFKKDTKLFTVPKLFVSILIANDTINVSQSDTLQVDSLMIPLKVNGEGFTDILVKTAKQGPYSKIRINYTETSQYVSPGCGIRKLYDNLTSTLVTPNPVKAIEQNANQIHDELKTVLYFDF